VTQPNPGGLRVWTRAEIATTAAELAAAITRRDGQCGNCRRCRTVRHRRDQIRTAARTRKARR
jgi:hypothetical protein